MEKCIYYKNEIDLTYDNKEHVITAGIGGMMKLDSGVVSDKANAFFSPIELEVLRKSHILLIRLFSGIGKRGKRSEKKATKSEVQIFKDDNEEFVLGYMHGKKPMIIPQVKVLEEKKFGFSFPPNLGDCHMQKNQFYEDLIDCNWEKEIYITPQNDANSKIIGISRDKLYTTCNEDELFSIINKICFSEILEESDVKKRENKTTFFQSLFINTTNYEKWIGKIAFNTLAYLYGHEVALRDEFDAFRNSIIGEHSPSYYIYGTRENGIRANQNLNLDIECHNIHICKIENKIVAQVCIFGGLLSSYVVILSENYTETFYPNGFICDWKNRKEYNFFDVLKDLK